MKFQHILTLSTVALPAIAAPAIAAPAPGQRKAKDIINDVYAAFQTGKIGGPSDPSDPWKFTSINCHTGANGVKKVQLMTTCHATLYTRNKHAEVDFSPYNNPVYSTPKIDDAPRVSNVETLDFDRLLDPNAVAAQIVNDFKFDGTFTSWSVQWTSSPDDIVQMPTYLFQGTKTDASGTTNWRWQYKGYLAIAFISEVHGGTGTPIGVPPS